MRFYEYVKPFAVCCFVKNAHFDGPEIKCRTHLDGSSGVSLRVEKSRASWFEVEYELTCQFVFQTLRQKRYARCLPITPAAVFKTLVRVYWTQHASKMF